MAYPKGTKVNKWCLCSERQKGKPAFTVRRWVTYPDKTKKLERYPSKKIKGLTELELKDFVIRLNHEVPKELRTKEAVELKHSYINPALLDQYKEYLLIQVPNQDKATAEFGYLRTYFVNYFVGRLNIANPVDWFKIHKTVWAKYLQSPEVPASADTKKDIVRASNRFMQWLHEQRPLEVPPLRFQPLTKARYSEIEALRELKGEIHIPKYITDKDWVTIERSLPVTIRLQSLLAYHFGLRRSEVLGLKKEDLRNTYLSIERTLVTYNVEPGYGPTKGRGRRKVPYWDAKAEDVYNWVSSIVLMHPDTFTGLWGEYMDTLGMTYTFHDIRHTWITRMVRKHSIRDVQLAAGHKSQKTTEKYLRDDRGMDDAVFIPRTG